MEHTPYRELRKTEPTLDGGNPADLPDLQPPYPEQPAAGLPEPGAPVAASDAGGGWIATLKFWSVGLCVVALLFLVTLWVFDERSTSRAVPARMPVGVAALPVPLPSRGGAVPALVLLPSAPEASKNVVSAPAAAVALTAAPPPLKKIDKPALPKPVVAKLPVKPLVAKVVPKVTAPAPRKPAQAGKTPVQPKAKPLLAAMKKPVAAAKRNPPAPAPAKPKLLASVTPPPAPEPAKAAPATAKKCLPRELARECAARQ